MTGALLCAVDRGIASARAGIIDAAGALLGRDAHPIALHHPSGTMAEHRSDDIWAAVCAAVTGAMAAAEAAAGDVAAIGFGATCSLVARGADGGPVSLALDGAPGWDTLAWRHHRAGEEAAEAAIPSPEMQPPKLMWLKHRLPDRWAEAARICDLADFLTWRATGATARSACTLTSKWGWNADGAPPEALLATFGLTGMPPRAAPVGSAVGRLTPAAAADLHVPPDFHGNQSPFGDPRARGDHGAGYGRLVRRAVRAVAARRHRAGAGAAADPRSYGGARHGRLGAAPGWRPCPQPAAEPALRRRHRPAGGGGGGELRRDAAGRRDLRRKRGGGMDRCAPPPTSWRPR
jgi:ribulose kinase